MAPTSDESQLVVWSRRCDNLMVHDEVAAFITHIRLRSRVGRAAMFDGIQLVDLKDLSQWVAWLIISMTALSEKGTPL